MINITIEFSVESLSLYSDRTEGRVLDMISDENFNCCSLGRGRVYLC